MNRLKQIIGCILLLLLAGCEKDTEPTNFAPKLSTGEASEIYRIGATLSGSVQKSEGILIKECGVLYSTIQSMAEYEGAKISVEEAGILYGLFAESGSGYHLLLLYLCQ